MAARKRFSNWLAVRHYCETHAHIWYHAPMDSTPVVVAVRHIFKNGRVRITRGGHSWTIDAGHLDRLSYIE